jgi:heavy metal sensor kinase
MVIPERNHKVRILYGILGPGVILQLGQSMESYTRFIEAFKKIFISTMAFLVLSAALIGWFMARQALSGLGEVIRTARHISDGRLEKRVPLKRTRDEIDELAITFNEMLDRIQSLVKEIKEMSDSIAHDLKSPITRIRGNAEVTLTMDTSLKDYQHMAAGTIEECDRLLDIINTMLLISKTEAGVEKPVPEHVDLAQLLREACALFLPLAEDKNIALNCESAGSCELSGDRRMIQRMIANLLDNALKYTSSGGKVDLLVRSCDDEKVVVTVNDTGLGIPAEDLTHIFERFYRGDPSRPQTGSGLGLSLAQAFAQAHGGRIDVTSEPDKGSAFTITLPKSPNISS